MSLIASRSACLGSSGAARQSSSRVGSCQILQLDLAVFDPDLEGLDRREGGQRLGRAGPQIEQRSVARTFNGTGRTSKSPSASGPSSCEQRSSIASSSPPQLKTPILIPSTSTIRFSPSPSSASAHTVSKFLVIRSDFTGRADGARSSAFCQIRRVAEPSIAICMATWEPDDDHLHAQIDSLLAQSWQRWRCVISDDASSPAALAAIEAEIAGR